KGGARPQRRFWSASASPNTSRPQSLACDIGVRKKPSVARGPKLIMEMRQPHSTITSGVRQPIVEALEADGKEMMESPLIAAASGSSGKRSSSDRGLIAMTLSLAETFLPGGCL